MWDRLQSAKERAGGAGLPYQSSNDLMVMAEATVRTTMQQQQQQQQQSEVVEQLGGDVGGGVELHESEVVVGLGDDGGIRAEQPEPEVLELGDGGVVLVEREGAVVLAVEGSNSSDSSSSSNSSSSSSSSSSSGRRLEGKWDGTPTFPFDRGRWASTWWASCGGAVYFRKEALKVLAKVAEASDRQPSEGRSAAGVTVLACMLVVPSAYALSWVLLHMMSCVSTLVLKLSLAVIVLVCVVAVAWLANFGTVLGAAIVGIVSVVITVVFMFRRPQIDFAAANLKVAVLAVKSTTHIMSWALCMVAFRLMWIVVAGIAFFGSMVASQTVRAPNGETYLAIDCHVGRLTALAPRLCFCKENFISDSSQCENNGPNAFLVCFWMASVCWSLNTTVNVFAATMASSVSTWWSSPGDVGTVWSLCQRVVHSSLGSVSKATMIHALLATLEYVVNHLLLAISAIYCLLFCVHFAVTYVVVNTSIFVGMYRLSFSEAVRRTWVLLRKNGLTLFVNEGLVIIGLSFIILAGLAIDTFFKLDVLSLMPQSSMPDIAVSAIVLAGFLPIVATLEVVVFSFKAVYVCFLQDPEAFSTSHDRCLYDRMDSAWRETKLWPPIIAEEQGEIKVY